MAEDCFGSDIELPWKRIRELVLGEDSDLRDDIFEDAFVGRMKTVIVSKFDELNDVVMCERQSSPSWNLLMITLEVYFNKYWNGGGVWFMKPDSKKLTSIPDSNLQQPKESDFLNCLDSYFDPEVCRIKNNVDSCCQSVLEDLTSFLDIPKASCRLKDLVPHVKNKCFGSLSTLLAQLKSELEHLHRALEKGSKDGHSTLSPTVHIEKSLFIGRLSFAFHKHSEHIQLVLGSHQLSKCEPMMGVTILPTSLLRKNRASIESPKIVITEKMRSDPNRKRASLVAAALFGVDDMLSTQLEDFKWTTLSTQDFCVRAYNLWISWISDELLNIFSINLKQDVSLTSNSPVSLIFSVQSLLIYLKTCS